jgi:hypothetical protein
MRDEVIGLQSFTAKDAEDAKEQAKLHRKGHKGRGGRKKLYREEINNKDKSKT